MFVVLVGPKGSGKSYIGRLMERRMGVRYFDVEPLWIDYHQLCLRTGREPTIAGGVAAVHPRIRQALREHEHLSVDTTGASAEILHDLLGIEPRPRALIVRVSAPLPRCLERVARRDGTNHLPVVEDTVRKVHALSESLRLPFDLSIRNVGLTDDDIVSLLANAISAASGRQARGDPPALA